MGANREVTDWVIVTSRSEGKKAAVQKTMDIKSDVSFQKKGRKKCSRPVSGDNEGKGRGT